jgi:hypothetical protein
MLETFYGTTLEECLEKANNFGREIIHFQYDLVESNYPKPCYRLVVLLGGLK